MTLEGYEEAQLAGMEPSLTKGEKNGQSPKPTKPTASTSHKQDSNDHPRKRTRTNSWIPKSTKPETSASYKQGNNGQSLEGIGALLQEPQYRTVAGHVSRRANASVAADPPPPPPAPIRATPSDQRKERRKKTAGGGFGDDSDDSDSDSGNGKPDQGNGSPSAAGRRKRPQAQNHREPSVSSRISEPFQFDHTLFDKEYSELANRHYDLVNVTLIWENIMQLRSQNSKQAAKRKTQLMDYILWPETRGSAVKTRLCPRGLNSLPCDKRLDEYLERSLHRVAIEAVSNHVRTVMEASYRFIHEVEQEVIRRCEKVNHAQHVQFPFLRIETIEMAFLHMAVLMGPVPFTSRPASLEEYRGQYISPKGCGPGHITVFADAFISKMMRCAEKGRDYLESPLGEALSTTASDEERTRYILFKRHENGITNAFMEWLCEDVDINSVKTCPRGVLHGLRAIQRLKTLREGTRQIFTCQDEKVNGKSPPSVSLVMFKDNEPLRALKVEASELPGLGWNYDRHMSLFWRYSLLEGAVTGEQGTRKALFKVDMNGAILAIQDVNGVWVDWEEVEGVERSS